MPLIHPIDVGVDDGKRVNFEKRIGQRRLLARTHAHATHPPLALVVQARADVQPIHLQVIQTAPQNRRPRQAQRGLVHAQNQRLLVVPGLQVFELEGGPNARGVGLQGANVDFKPQNGPNLPLHGGANGINARQNEHMHQREKTQGQNPKSNAQPQQNAADGTHPAPKAPDKGGRFSGGRGHGTRFNRGSTW